MTTAPQRCPRSDPHDAHFHHVDRLVASCPGYDPPTLERDRVFDSPDWTPETLHLSHAAAVVVRLHQSTSTSETDLPDLWRYSAALRVWCELAGQDQATALTFAYQIATSVPAVEALVPPF